jgi:hypothetical protein
MSHAGPLVRRWAVKRDAGAGATSRTRSKGGRQPVGLPSPADADALAAAVASLARRVKSGPVRSTRDWRRKRRPRRCRRALRLARSAVRPLWLRHVDLSGLRPAKLPVGSGGRAQCEFVDFVPNRPDPPIGLDFRTDQLSAERSRLRRSWSTRGAGACPAWHNRDDSEASTRPATCVTGLALASRTSSFLLGRRDPWLPMVGRRGYLRRCWSMSIFGRSGCVAASRCKAGSSRRDV